MIARRIMTILGKVRVRRRVKSRESISITGS